MSEVIIIAIISSGALASLISGIFSMIEKRKGAGAAIKNGVQQLMFDSIKRNCKSALKQGYIEFEDMQDLERMHNIYHNDLSGNGYLDNLMNKVREMPILSSTEK